MCTLQDGGRESSVGEGENMFRLAGGAKGM